MAKKDIEKYEQTPDESYKQSKPKEYMIMFKENRSFDLHVGGQVFIFGPHGMEKVSESIINHPDFIQQSKYFAVREI